MKEWPSDHPKAKLMARKRRAIVDAARAAFLREGYGGAGMEAIAAAAGVSIMTLYRHAESKDALFASVIAGICDPDDDGHQGQMDDAVERPLGEVLASVGDMFQQRLADSQTLALFRAVMAETDRFPHLGRLAWRGLVGVQTDMLDAFLSRHPDTQRLSPDARWALASNFIADLVGVEYLAALLGLETAAPDRRQARTRRAVADLIEATGDVVGQRR